MAWMPRVTPKVEQLVEHVYNLNRRLIGLEGQLLRYALKAKVMGKSTAREATVEQFPISKGIAGVSMELEPGVMRELHWHATAAEWAFVNKGQVRTTVVGPGGIAETNDFEPGDVWYFPRGHAHVLECFLPCGVHYLREKRALGILDPFLEPAHESLVLCIAVRREAWWSCSRGR